MKNITLLFIFVLGVSCFNKDKSLVTYQFVNGSEITASTKKAVAHIIKKRLKKYTNSVDVELNSNEEIEIKLKSGFNLPVLNKLVENRGKLEFWPCVTNEKMMEFIVAANNHIVEDASKDSLSSFIKGMHYDGIPLFSVEDTLAVRQLLSGERINQFILDEYKGLKLIFGKPDTGKVALYGVEVSEDGKALVDETSITEVIQGYDQMKQPIVNINMNTVASRNWEKMTKAAYENKTKIAIVVNDVVYSAPMVVSGAISGGMSQISGDFTLSEAQELAAILRGQKRIPQLKFLNLVKIED